MRFKSIYEASVTDPSPTEAQIKAGNYKKRLVRWNDFYISVENEKGSVRSGTGPSGKRWEQKMKNAYGYFRGTHGNDKDHLDVFFGPKLDSSKVFVVNQTKIGSDKFDEHKIVIGTTTRDAAEKVYLDNYEDGWNNYSGIREISYDEFRDWALNGDMSRPA